MLVRDCDAAYLDSMCTFAAATVHLPAMTAAAAFSVFVNPQQQLSGTAAPSNSTFDWQLQMQCYTPGYGDMLVMGLAGVFVNNNSSSSSNASSLLSSGSSQWIGAANSGFPTAIIS